MTVEQLEEMIKDYRWEHFEAENDGNILVNTDSGRCKLFGMRIGLYMDRPTQAVMADGYFIRTRSADYYSKFQLNKLDPERLSESLYMDHSRDRGVPFWRPTSYKQSTDQSAGMMAKPQPTASQQIAQTQAIMQQKLSMKVKQEMAKAMQQAQGSPYSSITGKADESWLTMMKGYLK